MRLAAKVERDQVVDAVVRIAPDAPQVGWAVRYVGGEWLGYGPMASIGTRYPIIYPNQETAEAAAAIETTETGEPCEAAMYFAVAKDHLDMELQLCTRAGMKAIHMDWRGEPVSVHYVTVAGKHLPKVMSVYSNDTGDKLSLSPADRMCVAALVSVELALHAQEQVDTMLADERAAIEEGVES